MRTVKDSVMKPNFSNAEKTVSEVENLADYFIDLREDGMDRYTDTIITTICEEIDEYSNRIQKITSQAMNKTILTEIERIIGRLNNLNAANNGDILETDERELLVPIINGIAEDAGLDLDNFEDGDPTLAFRKF
ncbi:MAG: hypothetical protein QNJ29_08320 [Rhizobiaceae bacterium]|nr:hypothetical protein [Rhizobiaceae bacterium]